MHTMAYRSISVYRHAYHHRSPITAVPYNPCATSTSWTPESSRISTSTTQHTHPLRGGGAPCSVCVSPLASQHHARCCRPRRRRAHWFLLRLYAPHAPAAAASSRPSQLIIVDDVGRLPRWSRVASSCAQRRRRSGLSGGSVLAPWPGGWCRRDATGTRGC